MKIKMFFLKTQNLQWQVMAQKGQLKNGQAIFKLRLNSLKTNSPWSTEISFVLIIKIISATKHLKLDIFSPLSFFFLLLILFLFIYLFILLNHIVLVLPSLLSIKRKSQRVGTKLQIILIFPSSWDSVEVNRVPGCGTVYAKA